MPKTFRDAEQVEMLATGLIPNHHPELATARIKYVFVSKGSSKGGLMVPGKVRKLSGLLEWALEFDFLIEVAEDQWVQFDSHAHTALVDHLLERCTAEETDDGHVNWKTREPEVQEFATILSRYGVWHKGLTGFVSIAQDIEVENIVAQETEVNLAESLSDA